MIGIIDIGIDPVLLHLGRLSVHWYGVMYVVGITVGLRLMIAYAMQRGIRRETTYEFFWPILIACLIGGRLYYVVQSDFGWYIMHPQNILATWEGGMAFYGAVFAGVLTGLVLSRTKAVPFGLVLDTAVLFITPAQTLGRVGNIINGDIIGYPSTLAWATRYTNPANTFVPSHSTAYEPAAAYELLFSLFLFVIIWKLRFRLRVPGTLFTTWLVMYSVGQFLLFFARANPLVLWELKQAQITAVVAVLVVVPLWLIWVRVYSSRENKYPHAEPPDSGHAQLDSETQSHSAGELPGAHA